VKCEHDVAFRSIESQKHAHHPTFASSLLISSFVVFHCFVVDFCVGWVMVYKFRPCAVYIILTSMRLHILQWLNYSKVGGATLNSGVNVEMVPVVTFNRSVADSTGGGH